MNNPNKFSARLIATWAAIMHKIPGSRILFVRQGFKVPALRKNIRNEFLRHGIKPDRIMYISNDSKMIEHLVYYNEMDIALDTFPHVGGTTTCEALWMGVPTVTLVGPAFFERLSYSNLANAGLPELCTFSCEEYIETAVALAKDRSRREFLRHHLREQIKQHPLGQCERFVDNFYKKIIELISS